MPAVQEPARGATLPNLQVSHLIILWCSSVIAHQLCQLIISSYVRCKYAICKYASLSWRWSQATNSGESNPRREDCSSGEFSFFFLRLPLSPDTFLLSHSSLSLSSFSLIRFRIELLTPRCSQSRTRPEVQAAQEGSTPPNQRPPRTPLQSHLLVHFLPYFKIPTKMQLHKTEPHTDSLPQNFCFSFVIFISPLPPRYLLFLVLRQPFISILLSLLSTTIMNKLAKLGDAIAISKSETTHPPFTLGSFFKIFFFRTELPTTSTHLLPQLAPRHSDRWKAHPASNQHQWDENFRERGLLFELTEGGSRCGGVLLDLAAAEKTPG